MSRHARTVAAIQRSSDRATRIERFATCAMMTIGGLTTVVRGLQELCELLSPSEQTVQSKD